MASGSALGPPTIGELERLAQRYAAEAAHDRGLAVSLRAENWPEAADINDRRARRLGRTAEILTWLAREFEARAAQAASADLMAAE